MIAPALQKNGSRSKTPKSTFPWLCSISLQVAQRIYSLKGSHPLTHIWGRLGAVWLQMSGLFKCKWCSSKKIAMPGPPLQGQVPLTSQGVSLHLGHLPVWEMSGIHKGLESELLHFCLLRQRIAMAISLLICQNITWMGYVIQGLIWAT